MPTAREDATRLADLLRREHRALSEFLVALAAFDAERRWGELGHTSLFHFLVRELGLPNGPAYYRKTAAELIQRYPEIVEPLRDGRLHLTSLVEVSKVITPENRAEILPRFFHTSKREAKEVAAAIRPAEAPPLRTVVTAVRAPSPALAGRSPVAPERPASAADPLASTPAPSLALLPEEPDPCQPDVPDVAPAPARRRAEVEPLTADLRRIHLTVSRRLLDKLAAARDALSHSHPGAADDEILEVALDLVVERHRKRRGIGAKPRKSRATADAKPEGAGAAPPAPAKRSRHVPAAVWRAVWERDGGALRLAHRGRRDLRLHVPARARPRERVRARSGHDRRRDAPAVPHASGRLGAPAVRGRPHERLHAPEGRALLGAGRGVRRRVGVAVGVAVGVGVGVAVGSRSVRGRGRGRGRLAAS